MEQVNYTELTPLLYLERSLHAFPDRVAISYRDRRITYRQMAAEATRLARSLQASGIQPGDRIAYLCPNTPEMLIAHFGVPLAGGVLVAINTRLSPEEVRYICDHSGSRLLFLDTGLQQTIEPVAAELKSVDEIVFIDDVGVEPSVDGVMISAFLARGNDDRLPWAVDDERRMISINYTSGTTGRPKGVMYTHRGAYLNAIGEMFHSHHSSNTVYLWTLPMFHCNGWCTTWGVTGIGGRHVCLRDVDPAEIWKLIRREGVTHLNAAPTVLIMMANHPAAAPPDWQVTATTAGAPPSPTLIGQFEQLGIDFVHLYGLTETYGPHTVCDWQYEWNDRSAEARARLLARQGVSFFIADPIRVVDDEMNDVPKDGKTMGEIVMRGNNVMAGYFENPEATAEAFRGGWFHSGDIGVWHPDGYIELRDRSKDIIISGGENISTIEVEQAIASHQAVLECGVVAVPDEKWGERPKAFVVLKDGATVTDSALIDHVRQQIAHFKAPDEIEFVDALPKTATGKIQKFVLREGEWEGHDSRIYGGSQSD